MSQAQAISEHEAVLEEARVHTDKTLKLILRCITPTSQKNDNTATTNTTPTTKPRRIIPTRVYKDDDDETKEEEKEEKKNYKNDGEMDADVDWQVEVQETDVVEDNNRNRDEMCSTIRRRVEDFQGDLTAEALKLLIVDVVAERHKLREMKNLSRKHT